jgi:putative ABC transport system permease protein
MLINYFLITVRNFWKNKATSIIKIAGLAIGLSVVLLIQVYTSFQYSYDNYHKNGDRVYRVAYELENPQGRGKWKQAGTGHNLASMLQENFPEIETTSRITFFGDVNILQNNQRFKETKFLFADPAVLKMFSFPMKTGDYESALNEPKSIIISSKIAKKYFGNENPIGKYLDDNLQLKVTGIIDVPDNSHFRFDILASYPTIYYIFPNYKYTESRDHSDVYTYIMLRKGSISSDLENKLTLFTKTFIKKDVAYKSVKLFLEPLRKIQISRSESYYGEINLTKFTEPLIYFFSTLGLIILGIACFNFINISIAHTVDRTKEVGIRKLYGATRLDIFLQFIWEHLIYSLLAILISMFLVDAFLPLVSMALNRQLEINYLKYSLTAAAIMLFVTVFAGTYPSLIILKVNPVKALYGGFKGPKGSLFRSILIVSQFTVSIFLLLATLYISKQIKFFTKLDMGINTKDLVVVRMDDSKMRMNYEMLKSELLKNPYVISVSASSNIPGVSSSSTKSVKIKLDNDEEKSILCISIDAEFVNKMGIKSIEGRNFTPDLQTDIGSSFLLNESAVKELGIEKPVGRSFILFKDNNGTLVPDRTGLIVGIINDYNYRPSYETSRGAIFCIEPNRFYAMFIRINPNRQKEAQVWVKETIEKLNPNISLSFNLLQDEIEHDAGILAFYNVQGFIIAASIFSFLIALLGLFGLSIVSAKQRIKEVGIRRINGASLLELLILMNRKFLNLVLLSAAFGFPIVHFIIEQVIKDSGSSSLKPDLSILNYGIVFLLIVSISMLVVSWQSWRVATRNPVEALRYE